jgi:hypothetical protein
MHRRIIYFQTEDQKRDGYAVGLYDDKSSVFKIQITDRECWEAVEKRGSLFGFMETYVPECMLFE